MVAGPNLSFLPVEAQIAAISRLQPYKSVSFPRRVKAAALQRVPEGE
jgi:hypothetical protein